MRLLCEVQVLIRNSQSNKFPRPVKSTLAIGVNTKAKTRETIKAAASTEAGVSAPKEIEIILFTAQNKTGTRYKATNNIEQLFLKFVEDGKATIGFKQPPENVMIKCDPVQLKGFLRTLKLGLAGKEVANLHSSIAAAKPIPLKSQPQLSLTITKRSDYPVKGFPRSLRTLIMNGIRLYKLGYEVISLRHITILDIADNKITKLPPELGRMMLSEFRVSNNQLGEANDWRWLEGKNIKGCLRELDLSANQISYFPPGLTKCRVLVSLKLNDNDLIGIPFAIRRMRNLRYLHLSTNRLQSLPSTFNHLRLDTLNVWGNNFQSHLEYNLSDQRKEFSKSDLSSPVAPLWLLAARSVIKYKLPYNTSTLPWIIVDMLLQLPECACGKLCFDSRVYTRAALVQFDKISQLIFSRDRSIYADIVLCGFDCKGRRQMVT